MTRCAVDPEAGDQGPDERVSLCAGALSQGGRRAGAAAADGGRGRTQPRAGRPRHAPPGRRQR